MKKTAVLLSFSLLAALWMVPAGVCHAQDKMLKSAKFIPATIWEQAVHDGKSKMRDWYAPDKLYADRMVYWNDDAVGQFLVCFMKKEHDWRGKQVTLEVLNGASAPVYKATLPPMTQPKVALLLGVNTLPAGKYTLKATLPAAVPATVQVAFERADKANPVVPFPAGGLKVELDPQAYVKDGAWPITMGVPFPQGTLHDVSQLALTEDGRQIPAQFTQVCTWHPDAPGLKASVSWARVSFVGRYKNGKPCNYMLRSHEGIPDDHAAMPKEPHVSAMTAGDVITVDNGVIKFQVNAKAFRGVESAWFDANGDEKYADEEKVIAGAAGAYVVDGQGNVFESFADEKPNVVIEENGPARVVILADGWYAREAEGVTGQLCKFQTRLICSAGEPMIRVYQHTILTFDSNKVQLADVGFRIPVTAAKSWRLGADGKAVSGDVPAQDSVFLHQYRWDKLRIAGTKPGEKDEAVTAGQEPAGIPGQKSDGWFTMTRNSPGAVTVLVRDIWQKFPKEVEMDKAGFTLHFWPKHGIETFGAAESLLAKNIYKLWYFDQGKLLDLKMPQAALDALNNINSAPKSPYLGWDVEEQIKHAKSGNAQGTAIGNEFVLRFHKADAADQPAQAALFQQDPHARSDPQWNVRTLVEGKISAYDPNRFPLLEKDIDTFFPDYLRVVVGAGTEYGIWTYADVHDFWYASTRQARLHRVWSASHYRNVSTAWLLYFRGNSPDNLLWAAPNTDHFMDIDTVNYTSFALDAKGNRRPEFLWHVPGAMYHCKGFTPWGSTAYGEPQPDDYAGLESHYVNPDAFRYRYLIEGNGRAWELYKLWGEALKGTAVFPAIHREGVNTFGEELAYYRATWDPDYIPYLTYADAAMMAAPMDKWPGNYDHPGWHRFWHTRAYELLRDERIVKAVTDYCQNFGKSKPTMMTWAYEKTGDKKYLDTIMPWVYDAIRMVYRQPGDPVDGYRDRFAAYNMFFYQEMPYYIQALKDADYADITPGNGGGPTFYLGAGTHEDFGSEPYSAIKLVMLKPDERDFRLRLESIPGGDVTRPLWRVISPSGRIVVEQLKPDHSILRFQGDKAIIINVPHEPETGLWQVDFRGGIGGAFAAPFSNLPVEGTLLDPKVYYGVRGRGDLYFMPTGDKARVKLEWRAGQWYGNQPLGIIHVEDARGKTLLETSLIYGAQKQTVSLDLDVTKDEGPFRIYAVGSYPDCLAMKWSGTAKEFVMSVSKESLATLIAELAKHGPLPPAKIAPPAPK